MGIRSASMAVNVIVIQLVLKSFVNLMHPELNTEGKSYNFVCTTQPNALKGFDA